MSDKPTIVKANTRYGNMLCYQNDTIGKSLSEYGEYCHLEIDLILKNVDRNSFFLDIGANIGIYTLYSAILKQNKVIAFEPHAANYKNLLDKIIQTKITDFLCLFKAFQYISISEFVDCSKVKTKMWQRCL